MGNDSQRSRDLARAALLRERILGALRAAAEPMTANDFTTMSGIVELYHKHLLLGKIERQLGALLKSGDVKREGRRGGRGGGWTLWAIASRPAAGQPVHAIQWPESGEALRELRLEVRKADKSVTFVFEGLRITIQVLP